MASEDRRVSGSVTVESDSGSPQRVAKELWQRIAAKENLFEKGDRKALLDLYAECLDATRGYRQLS